MKLNKNIAISETGFVFDPATGDSYSLNPVASDIMQLLKSGMPIKDIISLLISSEPSVQKMRKTQNTRRNMNVVLIVPILIL